MTIAKIEGLLRETMGLDAASIGPSSIERAVRSRMIACHEPDVAGYWDRIQISGAEAQELIEAVVVPETWFFRDRGAFVAMTRFVETEWLKSGKQQRLLSLPCASGEEPYSMAMALLDSAMPGQSFRIHAIDISAHALHRAATAAYGRNSFRGGDLSFRDRHFDPVQGGHRISRVVRERVQFARASIFDPRFLLGVERYDVIFCRSMLIYFDGDSQDRAVSVLRRLLSPAGLLFVGPSETRLLRRNGWESAAIPRAFAFRQAATLASPRADKATHLNAAHAGRTSIATPVLGKTSAHAGASPAKSLPCLKDIKRLADQGRLEEAEQSCAAHMRTHGVSADGFCLLGLIGDSKSRFEEAAVFYRKALYLEPDHHEALLHLTLLLERQGDVRGANLLNMRIARLGLKAAI